MALDMTGKQFAELIGLDASSLSKVEKGAKPLLPHIACRIYEISGADLNFIYLGNLGGLPPSLSKKVTSHLTGLNE